MKAFVNFNTGCPVLWSWLGLVSGSPGGDGRRGGLCFSGGLQGVTGLPWPSEGHSLRGSLWSSLRPRVRKPVLIRPFRNVLLCRPVLLASLLTPF